MELETKFIGKYLKRFDEISSTNTEMKKNIINIPNGGVYTAEYQSLGRGRLGRKWEANRGSSLMFSIVLKPSCKCEKFPTITPLVALCMVKVLEKMNFNASIKWPNDILINKKKCCGILCEAIFDKSNAIIIGIGLNVNSKKDEFDDSFKNHVTSLSLEKKDNYKREEILFDFLNTFEPMYEKWEQSGSLEYFINDIQRNLYHLNRNVKLLSNDTSEDASILGLNIDGSLKVKYKNGKVVNIKSGEISLRGENQYV